VIDGDELGALFADIGATLLGALAGTLGRGLFTVRGADAWLATDSVLTIRGRDGAGDAISLERNAAEPWLVDITLEQAKQMAMEALDHEVVRSMIEGKMMGRYYTVTGPRVDRYLLVESINEMPAVSAAQVEDLLTSLEVA